MSLPIEKKTGTPTVEKTLRKLFSTLYVRGRSARALTQTQARKSIFGGSKKPKTQNQNVQTALHKRTWSFGVSFLLYMLFGLIGFFTFGQSLFVQSSFAHLFTAFVLASTISLSAGESLFIKEEGDILMHRPVTSAQLLRAKVQVLLMTSGAAALGMNVTMILFGFTAPDFSWLWPVAHVLSVVISALFTAASIVLMYQVCLKVFGREKLDGFMSSAQAILATFFAIGAQIVPRVMLRVHFSPEVFHQWWAFLLPPLWFSSLDDAIAGSHAAWSIMLGLVAVGVTGLICWLAFDRLAGVYEVGVQRLYESSSRRTNAQGQRAGLVKKLIDMPPLSWLLPDFASKVEFVLVSAYMARDRDVKMRLYPAVGYLFLLPFVQIFIAFQRHGESASSGESIRVMLPFFTAFAGLFLLMIPGRVLDVLRISQHWRAGEIYLMAPIPGPAPLMRGVRVAIYLYLIAPVVLLLTVVSWIFAGPQSVLLLLSVIIVLPLFAQVATSLPNMVPFTNPPEEATATRGCMVTALTLLIGVLIPLAAIGCSLVGWLHWFLLVEFVAAFGVSYLIQNSMKQTGFRVYE